MVIENQDWKGQILGTAEDGSVYKISVDKLTKDLAFISTTHHYIHKGICFESFVKFTLPTGAEKTISFTTPSVASGKYVHYIPIKIVTSADKVTMSAYENTSVSSGTIVNTHNHNRNSDVSALLVIKESPTVTTIGNIFSQAFLGGGTGVGSTRSGSDLKEDNEYVLKPETTYLIKILNESTSSNIIQLNMLWYEE